MWGTKNDTLLWYSKFKVFITFKCHNFCAICQSSHLMFDVFLFVDQAAFLSKLRFCFFFFSCGHFAWVHHICMCVCLFTAYVNYIPLGTAVIGVGNNLHLILPQGTFPLPVTSSSCPVTSVLTPISQVQTNAVAVKQTNYPPAASTVQRYRTTAPVLIPAPARKPSMAFASAHSSQATSSNISTAAMVKVRGKKKPLFQFSKNVMCLC